MITTTRPLLPGELEQRYEFISFFEWKRRRLARAEVDSGIAEIIEFRLRRAWFMSTCGGANCCPNAWLLESVDDEYVVFDSWTYFPIVEPVFSEKPGPLAGGFFPGNQVAVERWPMTFRVLSARATGNPVRIESWLPEGIHYIPSQWNQCVTFRGPDLPDSVWTELKKRSA